jgi:hypothetical protein
MATEDPMELLKIPRMGVPVVDPTTVDFPFRGLLKGSSETQALSKIPELQGNLSAFAMNLPKSFTGAGMGVHVLVDKELDVASSRIQPFLDYVDSPKFVERLSELSKGIKSLDARKGGELALHVRSVHRAFGDLNPERLGYILRLGLQQPLLNPSPLTVKQAHIWAAYLLSGASPPEAATMDVSRGKRGAQHTGRQAVSLGLESMRPETPYLFGTSQSEHLRRLNLTTGREGQGHMLASMGMKTPTEIPGEIYQEQVLSRPRGRGFPQPETKARAALGRDVVRVDQSSRAAKKALGGATSKVDFTNKWKKSMIGFLEGIVSGAQAQGPGLLVPGKSQQLSVPGFNAKDLVDKAFQEANMIEHGSKVAATSANRLKKMNRILQGYIDNYLDSNRRSDKLSSDVTERLRRVEREFLSHFAKEGNLKNIVPKVRNLTKGSQALASGAVAEGRIGGEVGKMLKALGRTPPKVLPMFLVAAIAAGLTAMEEGS